MDGAVRLLVPTAEAMRAVGGVVGEMATPGDVVSLSGDLGAGKTTFVQGAAAALGVRDPVLSPTFTLIREYGGRLPVYHLDVYRLGRFQEVLDLGFDEYLDRRGVVFIEWGDAIEQLLPPEHLRAELTLVEESEGRLVSFTPAGPGWAARMFRLAERTVEWWVREG